MIRVVRPAPYNNWPPGFGVTCDHIVLRPGITRYPIEQEFVEDLSMQTARGFCPLYAALAAVTGRLAERLPDYLERLNRGEFQQWPPR